MSALGRLLKQFALAPLRLGPIRSRVAFWLNQQHYPELNIAVPLSHGLVSPIHSPEYWCSFSEIFVHREYAPAFELMPLPDRWLDLGCHAGFFSLYVEWRRRQNGQLHSPDCLLIDADDRVAAAIQRVSQAAGVSFEFLAGAIGPSGGGQMAFKERSFMASSAAAADSSDGRARSVPILSTESIWGKLAPPYDLIKVDIEGSEFDLLRGYGSLLSEARHLLLEWHSWHAGGGGRDQLVELAKSLGFVLRSEVQPGHSVAPGKVCGVLLLENSARVSMKIAV